MIVFPWYIMICGGAYRVLASCDAVYVLTIIDDFSRVVWVYLLLEESEMSQIIKNFCVMIEL